MNPPLWGLFLVSGLGLAFAFLVVAVRSSHTKDVLEDHLKRHEEEEKNRAEAQRAIDETLKSLKGMIPIRVDAKKRRGAKGGKEKTGGK